MTVTLASPSGAVRYSDSADHFANGLLRLMNLSAADFDRWLALAEEAPADGLLERLGVGWRALRPPPPATAPEDGSVGPGPRGLHGRILHPAIAESPDYGVAVSDAAGHGWLVRWDGEAFACEQQPPSYEEEYFEGDKLTAGGYGDYTAQGAWRLEKSVRQVREMRERTGLRNGRVLDIGSGYGFFRVALGQAGFEHDGIEVSAFARAIAHSSYGLQTYGGTLAEHHAGWSERYDAVTLFDLIEHLADPDALMRQVAHVLRPGGVVGIKTPNLGCPEADLFGPHYHSLKREHLAFFTPASLNATAIRAGLEPEDVRTASHLLVGFVGREQTSAWERGLRGADLVVWCRKPA